MLFSSTVFFNLPLMGGSSHYIVFFQIILTVHLLFIGTFTQVHVPSGIFSGFMYTVVVEIALFRGLLHINATRKVAAVHLMRWQQPFFIDISTFLSSSYVTEVRLYHWTPLEGHSSHLCAYVIDVNLIREG